MVEWLSKRLGDQLSAKHPQPHTHIRRAIQKRYWRARPRLSRADHRGQAVDRQSLQPRLHDRTPAAAAGAACGGEGRGACAL